MNNNIILLMANLLAKLVEEKIGEDTWDGQMGDIEDHSLYAPRQKLVQAIADMLIEEKK